MLIPCRIAIRKNERLRRNHAIGPSDSVGRIFEIAEIELVLYAELRESRHFLEPTA